MKYLKYFESISNHLTDKEIANICDQYNIKKYTINMDGSIDVNQNVNLSKRILYKIPLNFNIVNGYFDCSYNRLNNLIGGPLECNGHFDCSYNGQLFSLEGCPKIFNKFYCTGSKIYLILKQIDTDDNLKMFFQIYEDYNPIKVITDLNGKPRGVLTKFKMDGLFNELDLIFDYNAEYLKDLYIIK